MKKPIIWAPRIKISLPLFLSLFWVAPQKTAQYTADISNSMRDVSRLHINEKLYRKSRAKLERKWKHLNKKSQQAQKSRGKGASWNSFPNSWVPAALLYCRVSSTFCQLYWLFAVTVNMVFGGRKLKVILWNVAWNWKSSYNLKAKRARTPGKGECLFCAAHMSSMFVNVYIGYSHLV